MSKETTYTATEVGVLAVVAPFVIVLVSVATIPFAMWQAWVGMKLWNWFPAVYFHLQPISMWMMLGITYAFGTFRRSLVYKDHELNWGSEIVSFTIVPAVTLGIGYLVHLKLQ